MSECVIPVEQSSFQQEVLGSELPVLVDFGAPWCSYCRALNPVLEQVAGEYRGTVKFVKVNVDENPHLNHTYGISGIPALLFFHRDRVLGRDLDALTPPALRAALSQWLQQVEIPA